MGCHHEERKFCTKSCYSFFTIDNSSVCDGSNQCNLLQLKVKNSTLSREEIKNENQPNKNPVSAHSSQRKELYPS